ncbi:MAG: glycosyltransferase family 4 protein [Candidatus Rokuibacteriota bacterium]
MPEIVYLALPMGTAHGWGVCGRYITRELARLAPVRLITDRLDAGLVGDELELVALRALLAPAELQQPGPAIQLDHPILQCVLGADLTPMRPRLRGRRTVGYAFFENTAFPPSSLDTARQHYDVLATGSSWCSEILRQHGLANVRTVVQGIDPTIFRAVGGGREFFGDRFVVFSGGKFELRKGQDLVIAAFKVLQERHDDVLLVTSWFNQWPPTMRTMRASPYIRFEPPSGPVEYQNFVQGVLAANGIDATRAIHLGLRPNALMARVYRNSDVGLFPSRCEGGTNLVLMEYMACGGAAIATFASGHQDILTDQNSLPLRRLREATVRDGDEPPKVWHDADLEEVVEKLEWAYQNREKLAELGARAAQDMTRFTWAATARGFLDLL